MMNRRTFLKTGATGAAAAVLTGCRNMPAGRKNEGKVAQNFPGVGLLGFGAMRWPGKKTDEGFEVDQQAVNAMVDRALECGVNYFDSAPVYLRGTSEAATATALLRHSRDEYLIATKCSNMRGDVSFDAGRDMYLKSLETFRTDHIDYYLLHNLSGAQAFRKRFEDNALIDYFLAERDCGHIRNLGFSFHGDSAGFDEMVEICLKYKLDFVQIQMNYSDWRHSGGDANAEYMYGKLAALDIPVVIMEPLLGGGLAELPAGLYEKLKAKESSQSIASWAFRFCGSFPKVLTVLSGMTCMEHLEDNLKTFIGFRALDSGEMDLLEYVAGKLAEFPLVPCTSCQYCMPCPYGINIPGLFSFYNKNIKEGTYVVSADQKNFASARRKYLLEYNKSVPTARQADHCIGCRKCLPKCPQYIDIPKRLLHIDRYIDKLKQGKL